MSIQFKLTKTTVNDIDCIASKPVRGSEGAAGYDLCAYLPKAVFQVQTDDSIEEMVYIPPGARALISTGVKMSIPQGYYGRVAPRSGLAWKNGLDVMAGVIDSDFRGEVGVVLINLGSKPFNVSHGDRIAQIIFEKISSPNLEEVSGELPVSIRGAGGYGSTGVRPQLPRMSALAPPPRLNLTPLINEFGNTVQAALIGLNAQTQAQFADICSMIDAARTQLTIDTEEKQ